MDRTESETRQFKAEVRQILDIVIHSLYTHREIFIRELVSNAADALEKMRHELLVQKSVADPETPLEIRIETDKDSGTLTIRDTGVGMTADELTSNLGTIARSGTRQFLEQLSEDRRREADLIGRFGVGFYSSFMAASEVRVRTRSFKPSAKGCEWVSDGAGEYTITRMEDLPRGTTVIVNLREDAGEFADPGQVREIVRRYSNFVPFPIFVDGEQVNTVQAIWTRQPSELTDEEYEGFFAFLSDTDRPPHYRLHVTADAPLQLSAILYVPTYNLEQFGLVHLKSQVNLYCRKVLVQQHAEDLLPEYFRFVLGVVDSSDLPLNISRETLQDNAVFRKIGRVLTRRLIKFLGQEADSDPAKYAEFWNLFGLFIREGVISDHENRADLAPLLRFRSSIGDEAALVSLGKYAGRMREGQTAIYYLSGRSRADIENGPYIEAFRARNIEVLYLLDPIDDFVMTALGEFDGKKLVSADAADISLPGQPPEPTAEKTLSGDTLSNLAAWMREVLGDRVADVRTTDRTTNRPAIIVNPDEYMTTTMRKVLRASGRDVGPEMPRILEINPAHSLITRLSALRDGTADKGFLMLCVEELFDGALVEAGLLEHPGTMVSRMHDIMGRALDAAESQSGPTM